MAPTTSEYVPWSFTPLLLSVVVVSGCEFNAVASTEASDWDDVIGLQQTDDSSITRSCEGCLISFESSWLKQSASACELLESPGSKGISMTILLMMCHYQHLFPVHALALSSSSDCSLKICVYNDNKSATKWYTLVFLFIWFKCGSSKKISKPWPPRAECWILMVGLRRMWQLFAQASSPRALPTLWARPGDCSRLDIEALQSSNGGVNVKFNICQK